MKDVYLLRDTRGNVGSCAMFWKKNGAGYTTNIELAQEFTKEEADRQHECRDTDLPVPKSLAYSISYPAVDMQYVSIEDTASTVKHPTVMVIKGLYDGNNIAFRTKDGGSTFDLSKAEMNPMPIDSRHPRVSLRYLSSHSRIVVDSKKLYEVMGNARQAKNTEFYSCKLSAEEEGLVVEVFRWVAFHETEKCAWCVRTHRRYRNSDPYFPDLPLGEKIKWLKEKHYTVKRINKTNSRIAFPTLERALNNLAFLKQRQLRHLERNKLFIETFLSRWPTMELTQGDVSGGSHKISGTASMVNTFLRFD